MQAQAALERSVLSAPASSSRRSAPDHWLADHGEALHRYAYSRLRDRYAAEDVVQDALLSAWRARHSFAGHSSERTWLIGILKHRIADHWRKLRRQPHTLPIDDTLDEQHDWSSAREYEPAPDVVLEQRQLWRTLVDRIAVLPSTQARALALCYLEGLSGNEACNVLGIAPPNLWVTLHRARVRLREDLRDRTACGASGR
jgi:RNA polymerase sigma-70 factor, ECF subfamily